MSGSVEVFVDDNLLIFFGDYLVFFEDFIDIFNWYIVFSFDCLLENDLFGLDNDEGNLIFVLNGVIFDVFDYLEDFYYFLFDDENGVSLECIFLMADM